LPLGHYQMSPPLVLRKSPLFQALSWRQFLQRNSPSPSSFSLYTGIGPSPVSPRTGHRASPFVFFPISPFANPTEIAAFCSLPFKEIFACHLAGAFLESRDLLRPFLYSSVKRSIGSCSGSRFQLFSFHSPPRSSWLFFLCFPPPELAHPIPEQACVRMGSPSEPLFPPHKSSSLFCLPVFGFSSSRVSRSPFVRKASLLQLRIVHGILLFSPLLPLVTGGVESAMRLFFFCFSLRCCDLGLGGSLPSLSFSPSCFPHPSMLCADLFNSTTTSFLLPLPLFIVLLERDFSPVFLSAVDSLR